jgi:hypothetical protein
MGQENLFVVCTCLSVTKLVNIHIMYRFLSPFGAGHGDRNKQIGYKTATFFNRNLLWSNHRCLRYIRNINHRDFL